MPSTIPPPLSTTEIQQALSHVVAFQRKIILKSPTMPWTFQNFDRDTQTSYYTLEINRPVNANANADDENENKNKKGKGKEKKYWYLPSHAVTIGYRTIIVQVREVCFGQIKIVNKDADSARSNELIKRHHHLRNFPHSPFNNGQAYYDKNENATIIFLDYSGPVTGLKSMLMDPREEGGRKALQQVVLDVLNAGEGREVRFLRLYTDEMVGRERRRRGI